MNEGEGAIQGRVIGYLSFKDDRMYYIVIPLFEQKRAMVKIQVEDNSSSNYNSVKLSIKMADNPESGFVENINMQINKLILRAFKKQY